MYRLILIALFSASASAATPYETGYQKAVNDFKAGKCTVTRGKSFQSLGDLQKGYNHGCRDAKNEVENALRKELKAKLIRGEK